MQGGKDAAPLLHRNEKRPDWFGPEESADAQQLAPADADAARPRAGCEGARQARRRQAVSHADRLLGGGRPAHRHRRACGRHQLGRARPGAPGCHRHRQDLHHGPRDRGDAAPGDHPCAQQDPRGAALWRVQGVLPRQRGRIFRLVLRLLPARSLRAAIGHLHREGKPDQRTDRPDAPLGHPRASRARRRDHRGLGLVHLRHRERRNLWRDDGRPAQGQDLRAARRDGRSRGAAVPAQRRGLRARLVPGARRQPRGLARPPRGSGVAAVLLWRRVGEHHRIRPSHRVENRRVRPHPHLCQQPLRHPAPDDESGG